jgi:hypothetical protein
MLGFPEVRPVGVREARSNASPFLTSSISKPPWPEAAMLARFSFA